MRQVKMKAKKPRKDGNRGFLLPFAGVMIVLLSLTGLGLLRVGLSARVQAAKTTAEIAASAAADAGFTKAIFEMNKTVEVEPDQSDDWWSSQWWNDNWQSDNGGSSFFNSGSHMVVCDDVALPNTNATFNYAIEEVVSGSEYRITSVGQSGWAQKTISMAIKRQGLFDHAIYASGYTHPKNPKSSKWPDRPKPPKKGGRLDIDGYNIDTYSSNPMITPTGNLSIRTNSKHKDAAKFKKDIVINGDVIVGPGGKAKKVIKKDNSVEITGDTYTAPAMPELPGVIVPNNLKQKVAKEYEYKEGKPLTGNIKFSKFKIPKDAVQEVTGNCKIYVQGDMKIEQGAQLIVREDASLTLYLGKKLDIKKTKWWEWWEDEDEEDEGNELQAMVNLTQDPTKLRIFGTDTCKKIKLERMATFHGAVYAPFAKVEVKDSGDVYGALVGWDVKLKKRADQPNPTFHFDEALRAATEHVRFVKGSWHEL